MKIEIQFKSLEHSPSLAEYTADRLQKLDKLAMKHKKARVHFSAVRFLKQVEIVIYGNGATLSASAKSDDFHTAVDLAVHKLMRQLEKQKSIIQRHKNYAKSRAGRLERMLKEVAWVFLKTHFEA